MMLRSLPKVLVVDDENEWLTKLSAILLQHKTCAVVALGTYESADAYITSEDSDGLSAALIDVRLRRQIYDQGGLTLLNLLKERYRELPVLVLTAYSYDYPGLRDITQRYPSVLTYDKEVFEKEPGPILTALFAKLPAQIGDGEARSQSRWVPRQLPESAARSSGATSVGRDVAAGALIVVFLLLAALLFFLLADSFTGYSWHLNVIFAVMTVALIAVLLRVFKPEVVKQAVAIYREVARRKPELQRHPSNHPRVKKGSELFPNDKRADDNEA
jgi:CheY-like chemotaxis protein